jgi:hypothetical protein
MQQGLVCSRQVVRMAGYLQMRDGGEPYPALASPYRGWRPRVARP